MTTYHVVTTCNAKGLEAYASRCIASMDRMWDERIGISVYSEDPLKLPAGLTHTRSLHLGVPWLDELKRRHGGTKFEVGRSGPSSRWQVVRWAHKVAAITECVTQLELYDTPACQADVLVWLDADVVTHQPVDAAWLDGLMPADRFIGWPERRHSANVDYPECGVMMFRLRDRHGPTVASNWVFRKWVEVYRSGRIFELDGWTDTHALIDALGASRGVITHSLSGEDGFASSHPIINGPLGERLDHLKGPRRKEQGRSSPRDLVRPRREAHWS